MTNVAFAGAVAWSAAVSKPALGEVVRNNFVVPGDAGVSLSVREVGKTDPSRARVPVILVHGARVPGVASFDLPVEGGSLAAELARAGHRAFVMDARGYGGSTRPGQDGPQEGKPLTSSYEVVRDIAAVADDVSRRTGARQIALLGWATGGHWAGMYAALHPERVSHLVVLNSLYGATAGHKTLGPGSSAADPQHPTRFNVARFGTYRFHTAASLLPSWDQSIPLQDKAQWRDPKIVEAYQYEALASDPISGEQSPPAFRAPSGAMQDAFYLASGRQLWDAASITARVLIIRSGNDFWSRPEDMAKLQEHLVNAAAVRLATIPNATHYVHLDRQDRGRARFLEEVTSFLSQPVR